jgi:hypothetical protein
MRLQRFSFGVARSEALPHVYPHLLSFNRARAQ